MPVVDDRCHTCAGQRLFLRLPGKPRGHVGLAVDALEHVAVSRRRGADFRRFCGAAPAGTSRSRARQRRRETEKAKNDGAARFGDGYGDTRLDTHRAAQRYRRRTGRVGTRP
jgi:hypothetical protein